MTSVMARIGRTIERPMTMATTTLISRPSKVTQTTTCWLRSASVESWVCSALALAASACDILRRSASTASKLSSVWPIIIVAIGASVRPTSMVSRACALQLSHFATRSCSADRSSPDRSVRWVSAAMRADEASSSAWISSSSGLSTFSLTPLLAHDT